MRRVVSGFTRVAGLCAYLLLFAYRFSTKGACVFIKRHIPFFETSKMEGVTASCEHTHVHGDIFHANATLVFLNLGDGA